jgi:hypothetical protein
MALLQNVVNLPFCLAWRILKQFRKKEQVDFFCGGYVDYICFRGIHRQISDIRIVARNRKTQKELAEYGVRSVLFPTFPDMVIMARHAAYKYPASGIIKIGMRHGAYHFKDFVAAHKYNAFNLFLFTSVQEVKQAERKGIINGKAIGFPKIDPMFNGNITANDLVSLKEKLNLDANKKIVIFTATWDKKGYSAVDKWISRVEELTDEYNVLVTVHPWLTPYKKAVLANYTHIRYILDKDIMPYLMIADVMVADISSIIAEFCALDKPVVTFCIPEIRRFTAEIRQMLEEISFRVDSFDDLKIALLEAVKKPNLHAEKRSYYNQLMFDNLDGQASKRAIEVIREYWDKV